MFSNQNRPSKAAPTTRCQKCLKLGHYTYECKESTTERPYISRPSRSQQFSNPKLLPKLEQHVPEDLLKKVGLADEILNKKEKERKVEQTEHRSRHNSKKTRRAKSRSQSSSSNSSARSKRSPSRSRSRSPRRHRERRSRRGEVSDNPGDASSNDNQDGLHSRRAQRGSGSPPRSANRYDELKSEEVQDRREDRTRGSWQSNSESKRESTMNRPRERSLSPYSQRLALTKSLQRPG